MKKVKVSEETKETLEVIIENASNTFSLDELDELFPDEEEESGE